MSVPDLKFHKFVYINIYTEKPEQAPRISYIGEIIRLRRFNFKFTSRKEIIGLEKKFSNWLIYTGNDGGDFASISFKEMAKNYNRQLNSFEKGRIQDLRRWSKDFFLKNSLNFVDWWTPLHPKDKEHLFKYEYPFQEEDVDLIL